jgi:hypothetical protein
LQGTIRRNSLSCAGSMAPSAFRVPSRPTSRTGTGRPRPSWLHCRIDAPWRFDGKRLRTSPGDIVIMDNIGSHKARTVRELIRAAAAKLFFLPEILAGPETDPSASSPSSSACCAKLPRDPSEPSTRQLARSSDRLPDGCANFFKTQARLKPKCDMHQRADVDARKVPGPRNPVELKPAGTARVEELFPGLLLFRLPSRR